MLRDTGAYFFPIKVKCRERSETVPLIVFYGDCFVDSPSGTPRNDMKVFYRIKKIIYYYPLSLKHNINIDHSKHATM